MSWMQAFAWLASRDMQPGPIREYTERAEFYYQQSIYQDSVDILKRSLQSKEAVSRLHTHESGPDAVQVSPGNGALHMCSNAV